MSITAYSGPIVQYGTVATSTAGTGILGQDVEHNDQRGPMVSDLGDGFMDPRVAYAYQPGSGVTAKTFFFFNNQAVVDFVPHAINSSAFVASSIVSTGVTTYSIPSSQSSNALITTTIVAPETGKTSESLLAIDSTAAYVTFGSDGTIAAWNPGAGTGRNITIKFSSNTDAGSLTVAGRDMYGFKMTETISIGSNTSFAGLKAFKYVSSITNATTPVSTGVIIGIGDVFGLPLYVPYNGYNAQVFTTAASSLVSILSTAALTLGFPSTGTAVSTSADVRGTYPSSTATNGTIRLQMVITPAASGVAAVASSNVTPLFGATQFSSV
jgi:hypothetical protein